MKKLLIALLCCGFLAAISVTGCKPDSSNNVKPDSSNIISFKVPEGWPKPVYTFQNNALSQAGFELGRKFFYDVRMSRDNTISCGSCHQQFAAFAHLDHDLSHGINGLFGTRNSPGLDNAAFRPAFFWDGGVNNLENQPQNPIENPVEMDIKLADLITKLNTLEDYKPLVQKAYGQTTITSQILFRALAQFMAAMVSSNSKYDKYMRGEEGGAMSAQELHGLTVFRANCEGCHKEPLFTDYAYKNNGLAVNLKLNDSGRAHITALPEDRNKFLTPSLRNVDLSRPYMHDGRFNSLDAVVEHYRTGITQSTTLDPLLKNGIAMSDQDKADIVAFLKTLSDYTFTKDKRFADPN
ncbi:MAG: cytochrome c peroxidase [Chitinophagaceae bacterium]